MKRATARFRQQLVLLAALCLALVWIAAAYEILRSHQVYIHDSEVRTSVQAHVFAEYSRSTIKRINEFMLDVRSRWNGDWQAFSELVLKTQENIDDLTFQVAVIDKDGILAFSNLAKPTDRTDLSGREHFTVHKLAGNTDRLFISKPLMGKVSGKWSIQFTRPILKNGQFNGVVVLSISPEQFAGFARELLIGEDSVATVVRASGEIMARYPTAESSLGLILKDRPFLGASAPVSGSYRQIAASDSQERIFGFYTLPEYRMHFVLGESLRDVLAPHVVHRNEVLAVATAVSILIAALFFILFRSLSTRDTIAQQLGAIFELSPDGFVSFDADRRVLSASPAFLRMTRLRGAQITGLDEAGFSARLASLCVEQARFPGVAALRAAQPPEAPPAEGGGRDRRHLIELAGPGKRVLECGLRLSEAAAVSQILYFRDITHETEVDHLKSEFIATAAHELRTPMTSIYGFAELLLAREFGEAEQRDFLGIIVKQSQLTVSILNELLDLVRIEERRGKDFSVERIDLRELLREIVAGFKTPEDRPPPARPPADDPLWVRADRAKLTQAVSNVLANAYKYSPSGGAVAIDLVAAQGAGSAAARVCIRISDHGIGMSPAQLARVGERFYRADTSGKIPGTGLGMSIVREIIQLHGGELELASKIGEGTSVTICLPGAV